MKVVLGSNTETIAKWIEELVTAGWLSTTSRGSGFSLSYKLLDGTGQPFQKAGTPTVPESGYTPNRTRKRVRSVPESGYGAYQKAGTEPKRTLKGPLKKVTNGAPSVLAGSPLGAEPAATCAPKTSTTPTNHYTWT
jgi:hypothetical protein